MSNQTTERLRAALAILDAIGVSEGALLSEIQRRMRVSGSHAMGLRDVRHELTALLAEAERPEVEPTQVTRLEVIDHRTGVEIGHARAFHAQPCRVALSYQDDGRTLKVFVDGVKAERPSPPPEASGRLPCAWSEFGDGHDYSRTGKHDPGNCRKCLRHVVGRMETFAQTQHLPRYGVTWQGGKNEPLHTEMPDGYWTPWHIAVNVLAAKTPPPDAVDSLRVRLQYFVDRERGLSDWVAGGRKGQTTGREPSITPSVLRELEHILRDAPPDAVTRARLEACVEPDGEIGIDFDYGPRAVVSISIGERGLGFAALIDGFSASGRKQFDHSLPSNVLDFLRAHLKGTPQ
jgi:hypothetical protein